MNVLPADDELAPFEPGQTNSLRKVVSKKLSIAERRAKKIAEGKLRVVAGKLTGNAAA
jgi:hypothetical protein